MRHRDFRLLWIGQLISGVGDQMQLVGISWHLYLLTNSALELGLLGLTRAVPFMTLSLFGGALADTMDRKRLLIITQSSQMVVTSGLVTAAALGKATPLVLYAVTFLSGALQAFDGPARQAMIPNLVPRRELAGALTVLTVLRQASAIIGPGIGGLVIARAGLAANYFGNALSFLAVVIALLLLGPVPAAAAAAGSNWERVLGGLAFARREPLVLLPLLLDFATRIPVTMRGLLPLFAQDVFAQGAQGLGLLNAAISAGAVVGGLVMGVSKSVKYPVAVMLLAYVIEGGFCSGFGLARTFELGLAMLFGMGVCDVVAEVLRNTVVQLKTPDRVRGRVTALASMFGAGGPQLAQLESGIVAEAIGPTTTALLGGITAVAITTVFTLLPRLRHELGATSEQLEAVAALGE
ncbi:MAG: MFS transporter [Chloroflexota bacterium]